MIPVRGSRPGSAPRPLPLVPSAGSALAPPAGHGAALPPGVPGGYLGEGGTGKGIAGAPGAALTAASGATGTPPALLRLPRPPEGTPLTSPGTPPEKPPEPVRNYAEVNNN